MGIFNRVSDLVTANVHGLLDRAEDPELMMAQVLRDLEAGLALAREDAALAIAAERGLQRELARHQAQTLRWNEAAREALATGKEALARQALTTKRYHEQVVVSLESLAGAASRTCAEAIRALHHLEEKYADASRRRRGLLARQRACQARLRLQRLNGTGQFGASAASAKLERIEEKIVNLEDRLDARDSLECSTPEPDPEVENEMQRLRTELESR